MYLILKDLFMQIERREEGFISSIRSMAITTLCVAAKRVMQVVPVR